MEAGVDLAPDAPDAARMEARAVAGELLDSGLKEMLSRNGRHPLSAASADAGKQLREAGTIDSGALGAMGQLVPVEGSEGLLGLPPVATVSVMPGLGDCRNLAENQSAGAPQVLDVLSQRGPGLNFNIVVPLEVGEVWEKAPATIERRGNNVRTVSSPSSAGLFQAATGEVGAGSALMTAASAGHTQSWGATGELWSASDVPLDGNVGSVLSLGDSGRAGEHFSAFRMASLPGGTADSPSVGGSSILTLGDLEGSVAVLWQPNAYAVTQGGAGHEGEDTVINLLHKKTWIGSERRISLE